MSSPRPFHWIDEESVDVFVRHAAVWNSIQLHCEFRCALVLWCWLGGHSGLKQSERVHGLHWWHPGIMVLEDSRYCCKVKDGIRIPDNRHDGLGARMGQRNSRRTWNYLTIPCLALFLQSGGGLHCIESYVHTKLKHIIIDLHFVRERVEKGSLFISHIPGKQQCTDILTKVLQLTPFLDLKYILSRSWWSVLIQDDTSWIIAPQN